jgi:hypothetical protein
MASTDKDAATKAVDKAAREWKAAKKHERATREALAELVRQAVAAGTLSENKVAHLTEIPRMTIRKMLGKT